MVVNAAWGTELIQFLAALATYSAPRRFEEQDEMMNSSYILQIDLVQIILFFKSSCMEQNSQLGQEFNQFCPPNSCDDLCLLFCIINPSSIPVANHLRPGEGGETGVEVGGPPPLLAQPLSVREHVRLHQQALQSRKHEIKELFCIQFLKFFCCCRLLLFTRKYFYTTITKKTSLWAAALFGTFFSQQNPQFMLTFCSALILLIQAVYRV